jgi:F0F1-type ATP synthase assembly protein I
MPGSPSNSEEMGYYFAIGQIGLEMVVPVGMGMAADRYLGWKPWGTVVGAVLGLAGGVFHLVHMANRGEGKSSPKRRQDAQ